MSGARPHLGGARKKSRRSGTPASATVGEAGREAEEALIREAVIATEGNLQKAHLLVGLSYSALLRRMRTGSPLRRWLGETFPERHGQRLDADGFPVVGRRKRAVVPGV